MKTIFKSLLYFSFASLILTGCAKNDDFSVPSVNCEEPNIKTNFTIDNLYSVLKEDSKAIIPYDKDHTIAGIVVSSDQGGNFYQQLVIVDETTQKAVTIKADVKGAFALYPVGSQVFIKLKGTTMQYANRMITIGAGIYTSGGGSQYPDAITGAKLRSNIFKSCKMIAGDKFDKEFNHRVTLKEAASDAYIGKLITITDVQFKKEFWGKTFWDKENLVSEKNKATNNYIESKQNDVTSKVFFRAVEQSNGFKDELVPANSGSMTGIMTAYVYSGGDVDYQFYPRTMEDLKGLDKDPFDGGLTPPEEKREGEGVNGENQKTPTYVANFSNWPSFILATNKYGVYGYAKEAKGQGKDGKGAMSIKGVPGGNDYVYTIENQAVVTGAKSISFWIKGTSAKSLSFNVLKANNTYDVFNLATDAQIEGKEKPVFSKDMVLVPTKRMQDGNKANGQNDYATGSVNASNWIKITLDLSGVDYNTSGKGGVFAFKVGGKVAYDLLVSDIVFDGGKDEGETTEPEVPDGDLPEAKVLLEDFETEENAGSWATKDVVLKSGTWSFSDGGVFSDDNDLKVSGLKAVRLRGNDKLEGYLQSKFVVTGLKKVELQFGGTKFSESSDSDKEFAVEVFYSVDSGKTWTLAGKKVGVKEKLTSASFDIKAKANDKVSIKIQNASFTRTTKNRLRINIDDVKFIK
ncbi:hypothetical protein HX049_16275 [Myroides odoratimimus]|uniref:DUF5689 domain-containing protein n=1 Tax=Myroides odoratimimus TaxID=76832 RepID=UPI002576C923|nr:DUF5689 domain-containing protein [Myroides odoratimimus]MDM1398703.1 hypothetical protein [Myroides odoratimimus]